jgi:nucleoside-diphosphate-sugar epimerase
MASLQVFVTGASGLVGSNLTKYLAARGHSVTAFVRPISDKSCLHDAARTYPTNVTVIAGDLFDDNSLARAMSGCDVVVHAAAVIEAFGDPDYLHKVNVQGTETVVRAAIRAKVRQFIHISSLAVIMGEHDQYAVNEDVPLIECREVYANSKVTAEKLAREYFYTDDINVTILRPGFIYGPTEKAWLPRLILAIECGRALVVGDGTKETNVIYVENLCRAIELALLNPVAYGRIYNLTDGQRISKRQLFDTVAKELNLPPVTRTIPYAMARLLIETSSVVAKIAPTIWSEKLSRYSRPAFRLAALNQGFDISRAERELGYTDRISFAEGMRRTMQEVKERRVARHLPLRRSESKRTAEGITAR